MIAFTSLLVFLVVLVLECIRRRREHFQYFAKRNIPGPPPHLLWGHYHLLRGDHRYWYEKWAREYGDTFGVFWGQLPLLVSIDLELEQRVLIKEFSNFVNRAPLFALEKSHPIAFKMLIHEEGTRWKNSRSVMTPAFSTKHLKMLTNVIHGDVKEFGRNIAKQRDNQFDIYPLLKKFTMQNIGKTAFGIDVNTQSDDGKQAPLLTAATEFFDLTFTSHLDVLANCFKTFGVLSRKILLFLYSFDLIKHASSALNEEAEKIVVHRRKAPKRDDIMQTLLNSNALALDDDALSATEYDDDSGGKPSGSRKNTTSTLKFSDDEVVANSVLMLLAGYETTSTALAFTFHLLSTHTEIQERLREEILENIGENEQSESLYTKTLNLKYLDLCIRESLRRYPPVTGFTTRVVTESVEHKGLQLDAGLAIKFPTHVIHNDPRNFEDPLTFNPERFLEKPAHPLAYQPFGDGPRNCLGMRLALLSMKLAVCHVLRNFKLTGTGDLEIISKALISQPKKILLKASAIKS